MTRLLIFLYITSALAELGGVALVIKQFTEAERRSRKYLADVRQQQALVRDGNRWIFDSMYTRYGILPGQIHGTSATVESLVAVSRKDQVWTVVLLFGGIVLGLAGNLASLGT